MTSNLYSQQDRQTQLFQETLQKKSGTNIKTNMMKQEFHSKPVFSQELRTLTLVLGFTLEIIVHTESSISFLIKLLRSIMVMDLTQFTIPICQPKE
jgi:hypothetical protein